MASSETANAPDIVRALRDFCEMGLEGGDSDPLIEVMHSVASEAADKIDRLRSLLREAGCPVCGGDCAGANPPVINCPMKV